MLASQVICRPEQMGDVAVMTVRTSLYGWTWSERRLSSIPTLIQSKLCTKAPRTSLMSMLRRAHRGTSSRFQIFGRSGY
jgi:hypothetical protein